MIAFVRFRYKNILFKAKRIKSISSPKRDPPSILTPICSAAAKLMPPYYCNVCGHFKFIPYACSKLQWSLIIEFDIILKRTKTIA